MITPIDGNYGLDGRWQPVSGMKNHKFFVYSAYYDIRDVFKPSVRVIGVTLTKESDKVMCRLYNAKREPKSNISLQQHDQPFVDVSANIIIMQEHYNKTYHACYVLCPLPGHKPYNSKENFIPDFVSIIPISSPNTNITNILPVINSKNGGTGTYKVNKTDIGVCVKPLHSYYNHVVDLIEFIELNMILGVTKFIFYNETMSPDVSCVLNYYKNIHKSVSVMAWNLGEYLNSHEIQNRAVLASWNDCVYRNMNEFNYLMTIDIDEYIIPHRHDNIQEMITHLDSMYFKLYDSLKWNNPSQRSCYNFMNAFFYLDYGKCC